MTATRRWQVGLIGFGVLLLAIGGITLLNDVDPKRYFGIAAWMIGALIVHDGIIAFAVVGISIGMRRVGKRIPFAVLAIVQGAIVVAAIVTGLVLPEILKQGIGTANPSILPLPYAANLGFFYAGLAVVTALTIGLYLVLARRQKLRPSIAQD